MCANDPAPAGARSARRSSASPSSTDIPTRRAGSVIARRSCSRPIGETSSCSCARAVRSSSSRAACPKKSARKLNATRQSSLPRRASVARNARLTSGEQRVKISSNWSMTTTACASPSPLVHSSNAASGSAPGVMSRPRHRLPRAPASTAGSTPARSSDDFPEPEAPITATTGFGRDGPATIARSRSTIAVASSSRPKKRSASAALNASSPR